MIGRLGFACKYLHPDQSQKKKVLEVPDLNEAASTLNERTKFGFYEDLNDKDTLQ